jgi:uncharacterized protein (DUF952 family)
MTRRLIFHACRRDEWTEALAIGVYAGSSQDAADGFIHFSTAEQMEESVAKHRAGQDDLMLLSVDPTKLGERLRWEPSRAATKCPPRAQEGLAAPNPPSSSGAAARRGGQLFPHLYGALPIAAVIQAAALTLGPCGRHVFPPDWRNPASGSSETGS